MFKHLKTSTQISLKFTIFTVGVVLFFAIIANLLFFKNRYSNEKYILNNGSKPIVKQRNILGKNRNINIEIYPLHSLEGQAIIQSKRYPSIAKIEDFYFIYKVVGDKVLTNHITPHINIQKNLILISIYLTIFFGIFSYIISGGFVNNSLKKLNDLLKFLDKLDINNLNQKIEISGHPMDEINRLSRKFNEALEKINLQTNSLKDFVSNASHEIRTPLMTINSEIDYTEKSKKYKQGLINIKDQIKNIDKLLETLVKITKIEYLDSIETKNINVAQHTINIVKDISNLYQEKNITLNLNIEENIYKNINIESRNIIIKNLLENAYKFSHNNSSIDITLNQNNFIIQDQGIGISKENIKKIRDRFRQADSSKTDTQSFGLGLFLTKLLVNKHGWKIDIESKLNKGTKISISFDL